MKKVKRKLAPVKAKTGPKGPRELPEGMIGIAGLAERMGVAPWWIRARLVKLEVSKKGSMFLWKDGSRELQSLIKKLQAA